MLPHGRPSSPEIDLSAYESNPGEKAGSSKILVANDFVPSESRLPEVSSPSFSSLSPNSIQPSNFNSGNLRASSSSVLSMHSNTPFAHKLPQYSVKLIQDLASLGRISALEEAKSCRLELGELKEEIEEEKEEVEYEMEERPRVLTSEGPLLKLAAEAGETILVRRGDEESFEEPSILEESGISSINPSMGTGGRMEMRGRKERLLIDT